MKAFIVVACLLITIVGIYGADNARLQQFYSFRKSCAQEMNVPEQLNPDILYCMIKKNGKLQDQQGAIIKDKIVQEFEYLISDQNKLRETQETMKKCHDEAFQGSGKVDEKNMNFIRCGASKMVYVDKI